MSSLFRSNSSLPGAHAGVDIGGTKVAVALAHFSEEDQAPRMFERLSEPTAKEGSPLAVAQQITRMLDAACALHGLKRNELLAVGVAACGPFVRQDGYLELANPNLCGGLAGVERKLPNHWNSIPLEAPLREMLGTKRLYIDNDAVAALQAERRWGALRGVEDCAYVTWSTGVGVGLCVDGRVLRGKNGNAGHAGHSFVADPPGALPICGCGNQGDIESLVSGSSLLGRLGLTAPQLLEAATKGDPNALEKVRELCRLMGRLLYNLVATLDLQRISLGGALFLNHTALLLPLLRAELTRYFPALTNGVELVAAGLGERVGDYGGFAVID